jgi:hypothetical protein
MPSLFEVKMQPTRIYDKDGNGLTSAATGSTDRALYVVVCGKQADGTVTPIRVDADGKIVLSA